jgi:hypothetical protein
VIAASAPFLNYKLAWYLKSAALLCLYLSLAISAKSYAISLADQRLDLSVNTYSDGDLTVSATSLFARKTLQDDTLSFKASLQAINIDDSYQDQITNAPSYSESQSLFSAGVDYLYYDSSLSLNTNYSNLDTTSMFDIGVYFVQELKNGAHAILMSFNHGWEDDSDLALHNKSRKINVGGELTLKQTWRLYTGLEFSSSDGDLINFYSARRFNNSSRTVLPNGRSEQVLKVISTNDIGKQRYLTTELNLFKNNWGQNGDSLELSLVKIRSDVFSTKLHARIYNKDQSNYFLGNITTTSQTYYSDHRTLAKQTSQELGLTGQYKFKTNPEKLLNNIQLDGGFSFIKHDYSTLSKITNSGNLLHVNLSANY